MTGRCVTAIAAKLPAQDYRFSELVLGIVNSLPFQMRRANETITAMATKETRPMTFITGKHIDRRTLLKGIGAAIGLAAARRDAARARQSGELQGGAPAWRWSMCRTALS